MTCTYYTFVDSPLGKLTLVATDSCLTWLALPHQRFCPDLSQASFNPGLKLFRQTTEWLAEYFAGNNPNASMIPLAPHGSPFRQAIWNLLCQIPYGQTKTYGEIARIYADTTNARPCAQATGNAIGHNPISLIIPCHRVIGSHGNLVGYGGGLPAKQFLLKLEQPTASPKPL